VGAALALVLVAGALRADASGGGDRYSLQPGVLEAEGDGIAAAGGKLEIDICANGGILLAKGDVEVDGTHGDEVEWLGLHVYFEFTGCAHITGGTSMWSGGDRSRAAALAVGTGLTLRAEGVGIAYLNGEGTWTKDNGDNGEWSPEGRIIKIGTIAKTCDTYAHGGSSGCPTPTEEPEPEPTEPTEPDV
jgi:hypothetical protein